MKTVQSIHKSKESIGKPPYNPVQEFLRCHYEELINQVSPLELLPINLPQTLIHGTLDIEVPIGISKIYYEKAKQFNESIRFIELDDAEHYWIIQPDNKIGENVLDSIEEIH